jgi:hypothetical protein
MPRATASRDFLTRVADLRDAVGALRSAPPDPAGSRALAQAHAAHLAARAAASFRRLDGLSRAENWEFGDDDAADLLRPKRWPLLLSEVATTFVELVGAADGLARARISWRPVVAFGTFRGAPSAPPADKKARAAAKSAKTRGTSKPVEGAAAKANRAIAASLAARQAAISGAVQTLRALVSDLQKAEEERLAARAERLAAGSPDRRGADGSLAAMRRGRLDAVRFAGSRPSGYGSLLRQSWLRHWLRATALLD